MSMLGLHRGIAGILIVCVSVAFAPGRLLGQEPQKPAGDETFYQHAAVAADHPLASQAGLEMLRKGGNVVDAAVATSFALSVLRPASSGIGGGGFMVIWNAKTQTAVALDYREVAPKASSPDMYLKARKANPQNPEPSQTGPLAVAVPGHVAGLCHALEKYGTLELKTVLAPSLRYCREGVPIDAQMRSVQKSMLRRFENNPEYRERYAALWKHYLNNGKPWPADARFYSPLGPVYERIAEQGKAGFYEGEVGEAIAGSLQKAGGIITAEDLKSVAPKERIALRGEYLGKQIVTMPPPSSGGTALLEILNVLSVWAESQPPEGRRLPHNQPLYLQLLTEAMKHAYADRAEYLGDTDFVKVPIPRLTSREYAKALVKRISLEETKPIESYGRVQPIDDAGTSHYSVMDAAGNAVACTETINTSFGSLFVEPKFGIVLNSEMDDFAAIPGEPNVFGLIQSEANEVEPGKKPLSSMTPTIVLEDGKAILALGGSGGPRIISSTLQVLLNVLQFDMPPAKAIARPRIHHQWLPNKLMIEDPLFAKMKAAMESRGHEVERRNRRAVVQAIRRTAQGLQASSDQRKHGQPAGY